MNEILLLQDIQDTYAEIDRVKERGIEPARSLEILELRKEVKLLERQLADVQRHNLEDRTGFKNLERNAWLQTENIIASLI